MPTEMAEARKIPKELVADVLPLTPMQEGMLFHFLKDPESDDYFEQLSLRFEGRFQRELLEKTWQRLVDRHPMLRTVYRWEGIKDPVQVVLKEHKVAVEFEEMRGGEKEEWKKKDRRRNFDLTEPPHRLCVLQDGTEEFELVFSNHHIIYDGWSNGILLREFMLVYNALAQGSEPQLKPAGDFKRFIKWLKAQDPKAHHAFWKEELAAYEPVFTEQLGNGMASGKPREMADHSFLLEAETVAGLQKTAQSAGGTLATAIYAAWGLLLQRYLDTEDVLIGTTESGRPAEISSIEEAVGLFINTPPMRLRSPQEATLSDLIHAIAEQQVRRMPYVNTSLVEIKEAAGIREDLFDTIVVIENYPLQTEIQSLSRQFRFVDYSVFEQTNFDLTLSVTLQPHVELTISHALSRFPKSFIQRMELHLRNIFEAIATQPQTLAEDVNPFHLLEPQSVPNTGGPELEVIHSYFEGQATQNPEAMAMVFRGESLTYDALNRTANRLAHVLLENGVGEGDHVALLSRRSMTQFAGIIGSLKTGAAFLPLAVEMPDSRLQILLEDAKPKAVLLESMFEREHAAVWKLFPETKLIFLDRPDTWSEQDHDPKLDLSPDSLAYLIYTSGSSGRPKGVLMEHRNLSNFCAWLGESYGIGPGYRYLQLIDYTFDPALGDIFSTLMFGGTLFVPERADILDASRMRDFIRRHQTEMVNTVPSMIQAYLAETEDVFPCIKTLISGGEKLSEELKEDLIGRGYRLFNHYGPTEATVDCMAVECHAEEPVSIGKPIRNMEAFVRDSRGRLLPLGIPGELCLAGNGLARGYLGDVELTDKKFVPMEGVLGGRLYKSGDLVREAEHGGFMYIGRIDQQVKIRGIRVELEEVEAALLGMTGVRGAAVVDRADGRGFKSLVGYVVLDEGGNTLELKRKLRETLPEYMVPARLEEIDEVPLTNHGKKNRKLLRGLPDPERRPKGVELPASETEQKVAETWKAVLKLEEVGFEENFFDIGGNSLYVIRLVSRLKSVFGREIPVVSVFSHPTVREFAMWLEGSEEAEKEVVTEEQVNRVRRGRSRMRDRRAKISEKK